MPSAAARTCSVPSPGFGGSRFPRILTWTLCDRRLRWRHRCDGAGASVCGLSVTIGPSQSCGAPAAGAAARPVARLVRVLLRRCVRTTVGAVEQQRGQLARTPHPLDCALFPLDRASSPPVPDPEAGLVGGSAGAAWQHRRTADGAAGGHRRAAGSLDGRGTLGSRPAAPRVVRPARRVVPGCLFAVHDAHLGSGDRAHVLSAATVRGEGLRSRSCQASASRCIERGPPSCCRTPPWTSLWPAAGSTSSWPSSRSDRLWRT